MEKKKKLLVYLHGFGYDKSDNSPFIDGLARTVGADILCINAPFPSGRDRGGYAWFTIQKSPKKYIFDEKLDISVRHIIDNVEAILGKNRMVWDDVILCGRSQGAFMAAYITIMGYAKPGCAISFCGLYPAEIMGRGIKNRRTPILWVDAEKDTHRTPGRILENGNLKKNGANIKYFLDGESDHDNLRESIIGLIEGELP